MSSERASEGDVSCQQINLGKDARRLIVVSITSIGPADCTPATGVDSLHRRRRRRLRDWVARQGHQPNQHVSARDDEIVHLPTHPDIHRHFSMSHLFRAVAQQRHVGAADAVVAL